MPTELVRREIARFLATKTPEVLCITGKWGTGKTYAWTAELTAAADEHRVALKRYAYLSLFGQNSLSDLRYALFEDTIPLDQLANGPSLETLGSTLKSAEQAGRKGLQLLALWGPGKTVFAGAEKMLFLAVRNQLVCIDDLERAGAGLSKKDVLGLISFLKEQRGCKVVLILNDEALSDVDRADFVTQLEKVADARVVYDPTPEEAAQIGVPDNESYSDDLRTHVTALEIRNIRVIRKIVALAERLTALLTDSHPLARKQALHTVTLLAWVHYQPDDAPPMDFVRKYNSVLSLIGRQAELSPEEKAWSSLLVAYQFTSLDEFDGVIYEGIESGYFDTEKFQLVLKALNEKLKFQDLDNTFQQAWDLYHGSFSDNAEEVLDTMEAAFRRSVRTISPINLSGTVALFKELGRPEVARDLLAYYVEQRGDEQNVFDLNASAFGGDVKDPDVRQAFADKLATFDDQRDPAEILLNIRKNRGWNQEDIDRLARLPVADYKRLFKEYGDPDRRSLIAGALELGRIGNASDAMRVVTERANQALREIGAESAINARRVRLYGVEVSLPAEAAPEAAENSDEGQSE